jgi:hypothetical protein
MSAFEPLRTLARRVDFLFDHDLFDLPDTERPDCHKNGTTYTAVYGRMHWDRPSQTITTGIGTPGQGRYIHSLRRRVITPHEAARLQGFPFLQPHTTTANDLEIKKEVSPSSLVSDHRRLAVECCIDTFDNFGWNPNPTQIEADIENFYQLRFR